MKSADKRERKYISRIVKPLLLVAVLIGSWSCDHETEPPDGPNLIDRFGPFEVFEDFAVSLNTVDFSAGGTAVFTAEFNKNIDWVITITGQTSGAVKRIEGFDRFINAENATWNGTTTDLPFFRNETCIAEITVPEEPDYMDSVTIKVVGTRTYEGSLVTDFEEDSPGCIILGNFEFELVESGRVDDGIAGQEDFFYRLQGTDNESGGPTDNFFVGLATILPCVNGLTYFDVPTVVPENFYVNAMIEGRNSQETRAIVTTIFDTNDSGAYEDGIDQGIEFIIDPLYEGWELQSVNMAVLDEEATNIEVTSELLGKIVAMRLVLISRNDIQPSPRLQVGFNTDYITFTEGAPLKL